MNEFLLLALVIVYMAISYRSTSREAQGDKQNHHNKQASYEARGVDDH
jgi:heme/copper-type cytochrome/quinol oxidase subunit 2